MSAPRTMWLPRQLLTWGIGAVLRRLPAAVQANLKDTMRPVGRLDYKPKRILMCVNSPWQVYRLRSCRKEPETVQWLETELRPDDCLYDIGANVGAYSLVAFAVTDGAARIVAFEPGFGTFAELCRNIQLNKAEESITPLSVALGRGPGLAGFRYSDTTPGAALHSWEAGAPGETHAPELVLPTMTADLDGLIDSLGLPPPNLIKLDVDGPELDVLAGARRTLSDPRLRSVIVELDEQGGTAPDVIATLEGAGFRQRSKHPRGSTGRIFNVIFERA